MIYVRRGEIITKRRLVGWLETNKKIGLGKMHGLNFFFFGIDLTFKHYQLC
jgi:hypothetical protein